MCKGCSRVQKGRATTMWSSHCPHGKAMDRPCEKCERVIPPSPPPLSAIDEAWLNIENLFDIEPRAEWEKRYPGQGLAMAIHAISGKRNTRKNTELVRKNEELYETLGFIRTRLRHEEEAHGICSEHCAACRADSIMSIV